MRALSMALAILWASSAAAQDPADLSGGAVALDGDTLLLGDDRVRLFGIDAPEMSDPDGWYARAALDDLLADTRGFVECTVVDTDRYDRPVAVCHVDGDFDLASAMVRAGWAAPWRVYSYGGRFPRCGGDLEAMAEGIAGRAREGCLGRIYDNAERFARAARLGRWARLPSD